MKRTLVVAIALATAMPVISLPVTADAQVLTGRGAPRRASPPRPRLSTAETNRLYEAEDLVAELDGQIADIQTAAEAQDGGLTPAQTAEIAELTRRRDEAQRTVERLQAKRDR
jgi:hypothetical protein